MNNPKFDTSYYLAMDPASSVYVVRCLVEDMDGFEVSDTIYATYHKHDVAKRTVIELNLRERENE